MPKTTPHPNILPTQIPDIPTNYYIVKQLKYKTIYVHMAPLHHLDDKAMETLQDHVHIVYSIIYILQKGSQASNTYYVHKFMPYG